MDKKEKIFFSISKVARIADVKSHVLRYWETEFSNLRPEKSESGQRRYRQKDLDLILKIKDLLYNKKYTISGAREALKKDVGAINVEKNMVNDDWIKQELNEILRILES